MSYRTISYHVLTQCYFFRCSYAMKSNETQLLPSLFHSTLDILHSSTSHSFICHDIFSIIDYLFFSFLNFLAFSNSLHLIFQIVGVKSLRLTLTSNSLEQNFFTSSSSSSSTATDGVSNSYDPLHSSSICTLALQNCHFLFSAAHENHRPS
jgi:hypothetical protein